MKNTVEIEPEMITDGYSSHVITVNGSRFGQIRMIEFQFHGKQRRNNIWAAEVIDLEDNHTKWGVLLFGTNHNKLLEDVEARLEANILKHLETERKTS